MNIFLIPFTWMRHLAVALVSASAGLFAWWGVLLVACYAVAWPAAWDGPVFLGVLGAATAGASTLAEGSLRREAPRRRAWTTATSAGVSGLLALGGVALWVLVLGPALGGDSPDADIADVDLVSLRYRAPAWAIAGLATGCGPLLVRTILRRGSFAAAGHHLGGGLAAGLLGAASWFVAGYTTFAFGSGALYVAGAAGAGVFAAVFGLLAWGVPDSLYAGWLRVVSEHRMGRRIPIDAPEGSDSPVRERFVGHYPRGLDLFAPAQEGVLELHVSVLVTREQRYLARGLTQHPTEVRRFLERIDLRYDPRRPAPLETRLSSGDRLLLGPAGQQTEVEFLMLPREER
jgi:hypothetical protein